MHSAQKLAKALQEITSHVYTRNVFRSVELSSFLSINPPQPLFDLGARARGQRFTPIGGPRALYVAEHPATAFYEGNRLYSTVETLAQQTAAPTIIFTLQVHLDHILDLTVETTQAALGTNLTELTASWQKQMSLNSAVPTHTLAEAVYASNRFQAIRYFSTAEQAQVNLVIWTEKLEEPSHVQVVDPMNRWSQRIP